MTLTLWRGDHVLGELRKPPGQFELTQRPGKPPSLSAILVPAPDAPLSGVWQVHHPIPGFATVHQYAVEPDIVAERALSEDTRGSKLGPVALEPMSPEEAKGVPRAVQLTVRDAAGRVYLPGQVRLQEVRYEPAQYEIVLREVPPEALIDGSVWLAFVVFASALDAPAT